MLMLLNFNSFGIGGGFDKLALRLGYSSGDMNSYRGLSISSLSDNSPSISILSFVRTIFFDAVCGNEILSG